MEQCLSLDRRLVHVFVAAIDVEITAAQAGQLQLQEYHGVM